MTTNNAISELPPPFFLCCSQKLFFWLCEICMSLCPKAQIIVWTRAFYWQRTIFFSLFYCLPKKEQKNSLRVKQQLGKTNWKNCLFMNLPDIHIFHFMSPPDLWYLNYIEGELLRHVCVCVHGNLHIVLWSKWPRKVMVSWTVHWLGTVQVWHKKRQTLTQFWWIFLFCYLLMEPFLVPFNR